MSGTTPWHQIALVGRRAQTWRTVLGARLGADLAGDVATADLVVVDGHDPGPMPAEMDATVVIVMDDDDMTTSVSFTTTRAMWVVDEDPMVWLPAVMADLEAGASIEDALTRQAHAHEVAPARDRGPFADGEPLASLGRLRDRFADMADRLLMGGHGGRGQAMSEPPPTTSGADETEPTTRQSKPRRLVVDFFDGDAVLRKALPPNTDVLLTVHIGIPEEGQPAGEPPVDVPVEPGRESTVLDVTVSGAWPTPQTQQISVPTADPAADSTRAAFELRTPAAGGVVDLQVALSYRGRPLQVGSIAAPVRARPVPGDRVTVTVRNTSSGPLPTAALLGTPEATVVTIDARGADLVNLRTGNLVPQTDVADVLAGIGLALSRVLGDPDAPSSLDHKDARALLVDLARRGSLLLAKLAPLGIGAASEVDLLVLAHGTLFPFELLYDGPRPERSAKVCTHDAVTPCPGPSVRRVCPFAFWGASRTICRIVQLDRWTSEPLERVRLSPVLLATAARVDDAGGDPVPSAQLLDAVGRTLASTPTRVKSWRGWRKAVKTTPPSLMVLLAHTEPVPGDHLLEIGQRSQLSLADVRPYHLVAAAGGAPLVVLIACSTAEASDPYGSFHGALVDAGAAAIVGTLGQLNGPQGARAASAIVTALRAAADASAAGPSGDGSLGAALTVARRDLLGQGLLVGLLLVSHGEITATVAA